MPEDITSKLQRMKTGVEKAEAEKNQLKGRLDGKYEWMKKEFDIDSLDSARKKLVEMDAELTKEDQEFEKDVAAFENDYQLASN